MAKKASKSRNSAPSSSASRTRGPAAAAASSNASAATGRMVLRVKSTEKMKRLAELNRESDEERRPKSARTSKGSQKKKNDKLDSKKPKKPPTAFFYFLEDFRKEYQEQNPAIKSMRDIGKACGAKWKTMAYEEKVQYYDIAAEKRREFDQAMAEFIKRSESEEDPKSEVETDSESDD